MYLSEAERQWAPTLWKALRVGRQTWEDLMKPDDQSAFVAHSPVVKGVREKVTNSATAIIHDAVGAAEKEGVNIRPDYIQLNWSDTLEPVEDVDKDAVLSKGTRAVIISGAMWVGRTRLIDNIVLGREETVKEIIS